MKVSSEGIKFIQEQEGLRLEPYRDIVGNWTLGYGHLMNEEDLQKYPPGNKITLETAEGILLKDLSLVEESIAKLVCVTLTQSQFDALADFVFNLGEENLAMSTLLKDLNEEHYHMAAAQFPLWDHAGGKVVKDLEERRFSEQRMFLRGMA